MSGIFWALIPGLRVWRGCRNVFYRINICFLVFARMLIVNKIYIIFEIRKKVSLMFLEELGGFGGILGLGK